HVWQVEHMAELISSFHGEALLRPWLALYLGRRHHYLGQARGFDVLLSLCRRQDEYVLRDLDIRSAQSCLVEEWRIMALRRFPDIGDGAFADAPGDGFLHGLGREKARKLRGGIKGIAHRFGTPG